jgi:hypothetical protein
MRQCGRKGGMSTWRALSGVQCEHCGSVILQGNENVIHNLIFLVCIIFLIPTKISHCSAGESLSYHRSQSSYSISFFVIFCCWLLVFGY